jgi:hypothetical protein
MRRTMLGATVDADRRKLSFLTSKQLFAVGNELLRQARCDVGAAWQEYMRMQIVLTKSKD